MKLNIDGSRNMTNKTTTALIAVVVVVIIAAAALYVAGVFSGGGDQGEDTPNIDSQLLLYGNANMDYTMDDSDLEIIDSIIAGTASLDDYPLADANADGNVDEADRTIAQALVNREPTTAYAYCYDTSNNLAAIEFQYPLENAVVHGTNPTTMVCDIGSAGVMAGYFSADPVVHSTLVNSDAVDLQMTGMKPSDQCWQRFIELDAQVGVGAIITEAGTNRFADFATDIAAAQIPLLRFETGTAYDSIASAITIGFICGEQSERSSVDYAELTFDALAEIESKLSSLTDDQRKVFVAINMGSRIAQTESGYTQKGELAGGMSIGDVSAEFAEMYPGESVDNMQSPEALSNYDQYLDIVFSFGSYDYSQEGLDEVAADWADNAMYFEYLECYPEMVYVDVFLPQACQAAYMASVMYPDLVSQEWADDLLKSFMEISGATYSFDDVITVYTYEDYMAAVAA